MDNVDIGLVLNETFRVITAVGFHDMYRGGADHILIELLCRRKLDGEGKGFFDGLCSDIAAIETRPRVDRIKDVRATKRLDILPVLDRYHADFLLKMVREYRVFTIGVGLNNLENLRDSERTEKAMRHLTRLKRTLIESGGWFLKTNSDLDLFLENTKFCGVENLIQFASNHKVKTLGSESSTLPPATHVHMFKKKVLDITRAYYSYSVTTVAAAILNRFLNVDHYTPRQLVKWESEVRSRQKR